MFKVISFILFALISPIAFGAQLPVNAQDFLNENLLVNPGFENGAAGWTASGGATKTANSTAKLRGAMGYEWDSNSAAQTLISRAVTIPADLQGKPGVAFCRVKAASGAPTHTMAVDNGTTNIGTAQGITAPTASASRNRFDFTFPSSGSVRLKFTSVAANEPSIYIDTCFLGAAEELLPAPGQNLLTLNSAFQPTRTDNENLEGSVGDVLAYGDAAGTLPVDMLGGTPGTICARDGSAPLNGLYSLKMDLGSGSSRQGDGCAWAVNVPKGSRGKNIAFQFDFEITGAIVQDELKLVAYDATNGAAIEVFTKGLVLGAKGTALGVLSVPGTASSIRVGIHVARTSTAALSVLADDFRLTRQIPSMGLNGSARKQCSPGIQIFDDNGVLNTHNVTVNECFVTFVGDEAVVDYKFYSTGGGSSGSGRYRFILPNNLTVDTTRKAVGGDSYNYAGSASVQTNGSANQWAWASFQDSTSVVLWAGDASTSPGIVSNSYNSFGGGARAFAFQVRFPYVGGSSNITASESSTFMISNHLANGTRVTSTPTKLGEYRSQLRNAGARTYTDTNGAPDVAPSATNGIKIYKDSAFAGASSNNNPAKYEIFVGKNKVVIPEFYNTTGRTGYLDTRPFTSGTNEHGFSHSYDPTTGVFTIFRATVAGGSSTHFMGIQSDGDTYSGTTAYFDLKVSENALAVTTDSGGKRQVRAYNKAGYGSSGTRIPYYDNLVDELNGAGIVSNSSANGISVTVLRAGNWDFGNADFGSGTCIVGVSVDASSLTTSYNSLTGLQQVVAANATANTPSSVSRSRWYEIGQVVRPHQDGNCTDTTDDRGQFWGTYLGDGK